MFIVNECPDYMDIRRRWKIGFPDIARVLKRVHITKNDSFLDLGCGDGSLTEKIVDYIGCKNATALDRNDACIRIATKNYKNIKFILGDVRELPFMDNSFSVVFSHMLYNTLNDAEKLDCLRESVRVTKKGGVLLFVYSVFPDIKCNITLPGETIIENANKKLSRIISRFRYFDRIRLEEYLKDQKATIDTLVLDSTNDKDRILEYVLFSKEEVHSLKDNILVKLNLVQENTLKDYNAALCQAISDGVYTEYIRKTLIIRKG